jgi:hypothetical protein
MEAVIIDERLRNDWEQYVEKNLLTIAWHSYDWSTLVKKHYNVKFLPIVALDQDQIRGILPLYRVKTKFGKESLISVPYAVAGGIVADNKEAESILLKKAIELYETYKCDNITLKQYKSNIQGDLKVDDSFYNRELNLTVSLKDLWRGLADINKEKIESASSQALSVDYPSNDIKSFYRLLLRYHHQMGIPCVSRKWIEDHLINDKVYSIALLKSSEHMLAGTMVKKFKKAVSFPFTCIFEDSRQSNMYAYYLYWKLIEKFATDDIEIYHSARIPKSENTNEYRLGWGGTKYNYYYRYYPAGVTRTESSTKRGKKRELFSAIWKRLPMGITRFIGPLVVKNFP